MAVDIAATFQLHFPEVSAGLEFKIRTLVLPCRGCHLGVPFFDTEHVPGPILSASHPVFHFSMQSF